MTSDLTWNGKTYTSVQGECAYSLNNYGDLVHYEFDDNSTEIMVVKDDRVETMSADEYLRRYSIAARAQSRLERERVANEHRKALAMRLALWRKWYEAAPATE